MALSKRYYSVNGEMLYEKGASRVDYLPDALGSITATTGPASPNVVENTYRMKPYGSTLVKTGTGADPRFRWLGTIGYRRTNLFRPGIYVRARHYSQEDGRWITVDPLWPWQLIYAYSGDAPTTHIDANGNYIDSDTFGCSGIPPCQGYPNPCDFLSNKCQPKSACELGVLECMRKNGYKANLSQVMDALRFMREACKGKKGDKSPQVCVACPTPSHPEIPNWPKDCPSPCKAGTASTFTAVDRPVTPPMGECKSYRGPHPCYSEISQLGCSCVITICHQNDPNLVGFNCMQGFFHELVHCANYGGKLPLPGKPGHNDSSFNKQDFVYQLGRCLCQQMNAGIISNIDPCSKSGGIAW